MRTHKEKTSFRSWSLIELLVAIGVVALLSSVLFPAFAAFAKSKVTNKPNLERISRAAIAYGQDYDQMIPIAANGPWRNLRNVRDSDLTQYAEHRTDLWPLILLPYVKDVRVYRDPRRDDLAGIWSGPALASADPGYRATGNSYRNQNQASEFGVNYIFLSPLAIPANKIGDATPMDFMVGEARSFTQAKDPAHTVFYAVSMSGRLSADGLVSDFVGQVGKDRGFFAVNAPGMFSQDPHDRYTKFWSGVDCGGDWCGDVTPATPDKIRSTSTAYFEEPTRRNNVAFMDGHVRNMTDVQMAAGTDYLTATPHADRAMQRGEGARITDKSKYLWNLDDNYYGRY